ncbi:oligoribonuclease [Alteromonas sp. KS69]|jgi:oligoribonuclease|uniref:Oligoribonuclease n=1 Tax=Alteromonas naphthalenivorans TaxID=715451 RepID=F5Z554_ALTNA|nr:MULTISPECIES: oligoribonuclease [Alteromonas]AEF04700.1 oligoribonuclease [Alteromonas naphthalenivorans]MBO7923263.1 oligoribonuclease [Alteromonas sp. K632G]MCQ8847741.1 oligoribonuclease [Alteromonas stellipolaris]MDP2597539.1 oligoribonuclease [Alteromonas stellipolaris]RUP79588.1 oligoribonuclease [Alteromonas sp. KS69]|tara:strand:+ start:403 stop:948 length:546 start_codon:yes stop_codon:yes gene_type:complete
MTKHDSNLVWIDMEMTGLDPETCVVMEIATIVTDAQLNVLAEGPVIAVHQPDDVLDNMDEWCTRVHGETGLTARCRASSVNEAEAARQTMAFLSDYVDAGKSPLCGNTIGQDRRFMVKYMPELEDYFHYRSIDVSSVKELIKRWKPEVLDGFDKKGVHLALDDIRESIEEMRYYREKVFTI